MANELETFLWEAIFLVLDETESINAASSSCFEFKGLACLDGREQDGAIVVTRTKIRISNVRTVLIFLII